MKIYINKYEKTFTTNLLEYKTIMFLQEEKFQVEVQFTCPDIQRTFNTRLIIVSELNESCEDFIDRSERIIKTELHRIKRIKRNIKINKILKNK